MNPAADYSSREAIRQLRLEEVSRVRQEWMATYLARWDRMIGQWLTDEDSDALWLMYSASYLGRTRGVRWAIDPVRLGNKVAGAPEPDLSVLAKLDVVLLTHAHGDHVDQRLWQALREMDILWVVPEAMREYFDRASGVDGSRILAAVPGKQLDIQGVRLTPFEGLHWQWKPDAPPGSKPDTGIDATGYLLEFAGKRWLFPGDTRTYDVSRLPDFGPVERLFAHLWLGRTEGLEPHPSELENFCRFIKELRPQACVSLAHLYELSRPAEDLWVCDHARMVIKALQPQLPDVSLVVPELCGKVGS